MITEAQAAGFADTFTKLVDQVAEQVLGKESQIRLAVTCLLAGGHLLIEDVPGVAKTSLAKSLAAGVGGRFRRVQFTPDLLPSDVTGGLIYRQADGTMTVREGPVFTNVLLADEINRAAPRTQAALLEAMAEGQVSLDGEARRLPDPFLCIATQNPVEMYGTYQLPEAQLDRFTIRLTLGYPDVDSEARAIEMQVSGRAGGPAVQVEPMERITEMSRLARTVYMAPSVRDYIARLAAATRAEPGRAHGIALGVSPRGSIALAGCAMVLAASEDRTWVTANDVKRLAEPVLAHRILMDDDGEGDRGRAARAVAAVLDTVTVPDRASEPPVARAA